ncbi:MAG: SLC13 family permease [Beijerinckiaceae bacterium]
MQNFASLVSAHAAWISLALIGAMLAAFVSEKLPSSAIAVTGAAVCLLLGLVPFDEAVAAFSNKAVITIAAMLVLSQALVRTGAVEAAAARVLRLADTHPRTAILTMYAGALVLSAFVNSTPIVVILIPLMTALAYAVDTSQKRLLIPLSYAAILGGVCTLLGTSTNLVVDGIVREKGLPGFGVFDITPIGLVTAITGMAYLALAGRFLLPPDEADESAGPGQPDILTEVRLREDFPQIGTAYDKLSLLAPRGVRLIGVYRKGEKLDTDEEDCLAEVRDRLVMRVTQEELATLRDTKGLDLGMQARAHAAGETDDVWRVTIGAGSSEGGKTLREAAFLSRAPVTVIGASRYHHQAGPDLRAMKLRAGDRLWVTGSDEALHEALSEPHLVVSDNELARPFRRRAAAFVVLAFIAVVGFAAFGFMEIGALAFIGVGAMLLFRVIDTKEAWAALDMDTILLIYGMLIVGMTLQKTGAVSLVVDSLTPHLTGLHPLLVIFAIYLLCSVFTELISNSAVAIIMTPLALLLSQKLGMEPKVLVLTVMFGASASFATPIGYQTNTLVYKAGNYRFADFLKVGVPMNMIVGAATCLAIYLLFGK